MELKKIILSFIFIFYFSTLNAELIKPSNKFDPYDVVKIQLKALKNNNEKDQGIKQTWIFRLFGMVSFSNCSKHMVCYNGFQSLSLIKISSRFEKPVKSYVESTIQILKAFF